MNLGVKALDEIKHLDSRVAGNENIAIGTEEAIAILEGNILTLEDEVASLQSQVVSADKNVEFLQLVTGLTGGGDTNLDGVLTMGVVVPRLYFFQHSSGSVLGYLLKSGIDAESSPSIIRPDDYSDGSNEKIFLAVM